MSTDFSHAHWRKSSRSGTGDGNACVEIAVRSAAIGVRDSKNVSGGHLVFGRGAWWVFAEGLK